MALTCVSWAPSDTNHDLVLRVVDRVCVAVVASDGELWACGPGFAVVQVGLVESHCNKAVFYVPAPAKGSKIKEKTVLKGSSFPIIT